MHESRPTYAWVMSHVWIESRPNYEWVASHVWMSHVSRMNEACLIALFPTRGCVAQVRTLPCSTALILCKRVTFHTWSSHVSRMNESCLTALFPTHGSASRRLDCLDFVHTALSESRPTCEWVTSHMWMSHVSHMNESCLTALFPTHGCASRRLDCLDSVPTTDPTCHFNLYFRQIGMHMWHDSYIYTTWVINIRDMAHI